MAVNMILANERSSKKGPIARFATFFSSKLCGINAQDRSADLLGEEIKPRV